MKTIKIILFLFLVVPFSASGQLRGEYCYGDDLQVECITFSDSNKFEYYYYGCYLLEESKGKYKFKKDSLILFLERDSIPAMNFELETSPSNSDSVEISIKLRDVIIYLSFGKLPVQFVYIDTVYKVKKSHDTISLSLSSFGFKTTIIPLVLNKNYNIEVKPDYSKVIYYNLNSIERYKITEKRNLFWRKKSIYLISENQKRKRYIKQKIKI